MLVNPVLKGMNTADLNQRYAESFLAYNGEIIYVQNFDAAIMYYKKHDRRDAHVGFRWDHVDAFRPRSQWYITNDGPQYLQYYTTKQYTRGFSRNTCSFAYSNLECFPPNFQNLRDCYYGKPFHRPAIKPTAKEIQTRVEDGESIPLSPTILVTPKTILFRKTVIGELKAAEFCLHRPEFSQEIMELVDNPVIHNHAHQAPKEPKKKGLFPELLFVPQDAAVALDIGANINLREHREDLRAFDVAHDEGMTIETRHKPDARFANNATREILRGIVYGDAKRAQLDAQAFENSFVWFQAEINLWRVGFHEEER